MKYDADVASLEIAERVRINQSTLIVPGSHVGLEGYLRIWLGGREEFLREGLRRIGDRADGADGLAGIGDSGVQGTCGRPAVDRLTPNPEP